MRMRQPARAAALSSSATTRLVTRLEDRGLLTRILGADDRRGIYTELIPAGQRLLEQARPVHDEVLARSLGEAARTPRAGGAGQLSAVRVLTFAPCHSSVPQTAAESARALKCEPSLPSRYRVGTVTWSIGTFRAAASTSIFIS